MNVEEFWRDAFEPDGALEDIHVYGTNKADYRLLLNYLVSNFAARYMRDGVECDVPDYSTILRDGEAVSTYVSVDVSGIQVNMWFHREDEMEFDILPNDVDSFKKAEGILTFMNMVAHLLNKEVFLTGECAFADENWSRDHAVCSVGPQDSAVTYHGGFDGRSRY